MRDGLKNEVKMRGHLGVDFLWIFLDFRSVLEAKIGKSFD